MNARQLVAVAAIAGAGYLAFRVLRDRGALTLPAVVDAAGQASQQASATFADFLDLLRGRSPRDPDPVATTPGPTMPNYRKPVQKRSAHYPNPIDVTTLNADDAAYIQARLLGTSAHDWAFAYQFVTGDLGRRKYLSTLGVRPANVPEYGAAHPQLKARVDAFLAWLYG